MFHMPAAVVQAYHVEHGVKHDASLANPPSFYSTLAGEVWSAVVGGRGGGSSSRVQHHDQQVWGTRAGL
jgi:hypothetical protein